MNIVNGLMIFLGSSLGALVVWLLSGRIHPFLGVFFLSSVIRWMVCIFLLPGLREVRQVETISYRSLFFRVSGVRASVGPGMRFFLVPGRKAATPGVESAPASFRELLPGPSPPGAVPSPSVPAGKFEGTGAVSVPEATPADPPVPGDPPA